MIKKKIEQFTSRVHNFFAGKREPIVHETRAAPLPQQSRREDVDCSRVSADQPRLLRAVQEHRPRDRPTAPR